MMNRPLLQFFLIHIFLSGVTYGAMTEAQIKSTGKLVRNMCQPKNHATDEDIDKMHAGDWNIDRTAMCYMQCVLASQKLITKDNILDYDYAMNLAKKSLPVSMRDGIIELIDLCKDSAKTVDDKCVAGYEIAKCVYEGNPPIYFLP